jgi:uncharacterized protein (UPF0179 family)
MNTLYSSEGIKIKCHLGHCEHKTESMGENTHDEGLCWKITQDEFADKPTNAKYCPCKNHPLAIRTYARVGYMERGEYDQMITRPCKECGVDFLFTIHEDTCSNCKVLAVTAEVVQ